MKHENLPTNLHWLRLIAIPSDAVDGKTCCGESKLAGK
jgi:hypothetical protein